MAFWRVSLLLLAAQYSLLVAEKVAQSSLSKYMLARAQKLDRAQFTALKDNKEIRTVYNTLGTLYYKENPQYTGFSVVISGKSVKLAVQRNKIRRRIYTMVRSQKDLQILGILYTSKNIGALSYEETTTHFQNLVAKMQKSTK
jgi:ribonuclease P protein component